MKLALLIALLAAVAGLCVAILGVLAPDHVPPASTLLISA